MTEFPALKEDKNLHAQKIGVPSRIETYIYHSEAAKNQRQRSYKQKLKKKKLQIQ